jgi:hypothetical protein
MRLLEHRNQTEPLQYGWCVVVHCEVRVAQPGSVVDAVPIVLVPGSPGGHRIVAFASCMIDIDVAKSTDTHLGDLDDRHPTAGGVDHRSLGSYDRKGFAVDLIVLEQTSSGGLGPVQYRGDQFVTQRSGKRELEHGQVGGHWMRLAVSLRPGPSAR